MVLTPGKRVTQAEYFAMDEASEEMLEYYDGIVVTKYRGSKFNHCCISSALVGEIGMFLKGSNYHLFYYKLRATTPSGNAYMYPDVTLVTGKTKLKKDCFDTLTNPSVIIEITTDATRDLGMGSKFWYSIQIPTLKEYIVVDSTRHHVAAAIRQHGDVWQFAVTEDIDSAITIHTIGMQLQMKDIYLEMPFSNDINQ